MPTDSEEIGGEYLRHYISVLIRNVTSYKPKRTYLDALNSFFMLFVLLGFEENLLDFYGFLLNFNRSYVLSNS
jgi:hypothetical protein